MFDAAIKALAQMFTPPFRAVLLKSIGLGAGPDRPDRHRAATACSPGWPTSGATWAEADRRLRRTPPGRRSPGCCRSWPALGIITGALFLMPAVTAFVGSFFVDEIADEVERAHYPAEPPGRALPLVPRADRGRQDRAAGAPGLSLRAAVPVRSPASASSSCSSPTPICSAANISSSPPCAFARRRRPRRCASAHRGYDFHRRPGHRGVRVDPDRQSGDAAVRHGVHGAHAQAACRHARGVDRAGALALSRAGR